MQQSLCKSPLIARAPNSCFGWWRETRSLIVTTNLEFSKWGAVFTDDQMTAAMIDRLAHHGHLLVFEGERYRMQHALMKER